MNRSPAEIRDRWLNYGRRYAVHTTLHDGSVACMFGPLSPEAGTLHDYSGRTSGATWSVGAGDAPKYVQGSVRGQSFWAGQYDGVNDANLPLPGIPSTFTASVWMLPTATHQIDSQANTGIGGISGQRFLLWPDYRPSSECSIGISVGTNGATIYDHGSYGSGTCSPLCVYSGTISQWTHLAVPFTHPGPAQILLNATLVASGLGTKHSASYSPSALCGGAYGYFSGYCASLSIYSRILTPNEIATLATHPLAAYETVRPRYWMFGGTTHLWPWQIRRSRRVRGKR